MQIFFEIIKAIFFFLTLVVGLFFLRGDVIITQPYYTMTKEILLPGYLIFAGLMLGYIIAHVRMGQYEDGRKHVKVYIKSFIIGIIIGLILALLYIFL